MHISDFVRQWQESNTSQRSSKFQQCLPAVTLVAIGFLHDEHLINQGECKADAFLRFVMLQPWILLKSASSNVRMMKMDIILHHTTGWVIVVCWETADAQVLLPPTFNLPPDFSVLPGGKQIQVLLGDRPRREAH